MYIIKKGINISHKDIQRQELNELIWEIKKMTTAMQLSFSSRKSQQVAFLFDMFGEVFQPD